MERCTLHAKRDSVAQPTSAQDAAFDRYVLPEIAALRRRANRLTGSAHDADDVVQETLLRAYRAIERFDGRYARAWLNTIMRHTWINEGRKRTPVPVADPELVPTEPSLPERTWGVPEDVLGRDLVDPELEAALDRLPRHHRAVVDAVVVRGLSCREAATVLSIPLGTVLSRLHRARAALRDDLSHDRRAARLSRVPAGPPTAPRPSRREPVDVRSAA